MLTVVLLLHYNALYYNADQAYYKTIKRKETTLVRIKRQQELSTYHLHIDKRSITK